MPRETLILEQDIANNQINDQQVKAGSNLEKLVNKKVIDPLILSGLTLSGFSSRLDIPLLDQPHASGPTDIGVITTLQHSLFVTNTDFGIPDGLNSKVRGNLTQNPPIFDPVTMTIGLNTGLATTPANFLVGDIVRIQGQGLAFDYLAEVSAISGSVLTFVVPGTVTPATFINGPSGVYSMERVRRWTMIWVDSVGGAFSLPPATYDIGITRRTYLADIPELFGSGKGPNPAETPQTSVGGGVPPSRLINTIAPLQGGGDLSADRTLTIDDATPLSKGVIQLAGDLSGTAAAPTVPGLATKVNTTRQINTTPPLQGGGDLSVDRTLTVDDATTSSKGVVQLAGDLSGTAAAPTVPGLATKVNTTRQINTTNGLQGGGDLSVDRTLSILPLNDSVVVSPLGLRAAVPSPLDKGLSPLATIGDNASTGLTISATPGGDGYVRISVNGVMYVLGDGVKTKDCYFSNDGGVTARAIANISAGDMLYWNGVITNFDLDPSDIVDMEYNV